ncbi:MAG TPA: DeoR family transcriptional regulator [Gaiellaceae bacterium]|nr:DeoR family transcriptional regulator [Gaiellaceae bacterium]
MKIAARKKRRGERERLSRALRRQWLTGTLLQRRGSWTVAQLADALGVSKATCQRDLDLLAELFHVRTSKDPDHRQRTRYRMVGSFRPTLAWLRFEPLLKRRLRGTKAAKTRRSA